MRILFGKDINVKWTAFNAGPAEVETLFAGDIDIGYIGPVPAIGANVKSNGDVQILSGAAKGGAILIRREGHKYLVSKILPEKQWQSHRLVTRSI